MKVPRRTDDDVDAILNAHLADDSDSMDRLLSSIRKLGARLPAESVVAAHVAAVAREALSAGPERVTIPSSPRLRRRLVLNTLLSGLLAKTMAAAVAVAALTGVGVGANASAPGDTLYGLDRALEKVGIAHGGAAERIEEARVLVDVALPTAVETAGEAALEAGSQEASDALREAALRVGDVPEGEQAALTRDQVAALLDLLASQLEGDGVDGMAVADAARAIRPDVADQAHDGAGPPESVPPTEPQSDAPGQGVGLGGAPSETPPSVAPPVSTPPSTP